MSGSHFHGNVDAHNVVPIQAADGATINNYYGGPTPPNAQTQTPKPCAIIPFSPNPKFVHRTEMLKWVDKRCALPGGRAALVGLGGAGKSQIAIHYSHSIREKSRDTWVFWVHASSRMRFETAYRDIAERLCLPRWNDPNTNVLKLVYDWLCKEENGRWFMVVDNADDMETFFPKDGDGKESLDSFLPMSVNGSILITSRNRHVAERLVGHHVDIWDVGSMSDDEALQVLKNLTHESDEKLAIELIHALNNIPLAIVQAAALIHRAPRVLISSYLKEVRNDNKTGTRLFKQEAASLWHDGTSLNTVISTWIITFEQIRRERCSAADLLSFMSFFNPHEIPKSLLIEFVSKNKESGTEQPEDREVLEEDVEVLQAYSLVMVTKKMDVFEMHPLVQFCTQDWLASTGGMQHRKSEFLRVIADAYPFGAFENWNTCEMLEPHIESIIREKPDESDAEIWAKLAYNVGKYRSERGKHREAQKLLRDAADIYERFKGPEAEETLDCLHYLGWALTCTGKYKDAERMGRRVAEIRENTLGKEHTNTLASLGNLAAALKGQRKYEEAEEIERRVLAVKEKIFGKGHPTLVTLDNLAGTLSEQRKYEEAERIYRETLAARVKILGKEHPNTLMTLRGLALTLHYQNKFEEAEQFFREVLASNEKVCGEEHPETLHCLRGLAAVCGNTGRLGEAAELFKRASNGYLKIFGSDHPHAKSCMTQYHCVQGKMTANLQTASTPASLENAVATRETADSTEETRESSSGESLRHNAVSEKTAENTKDKGESKRKSFWWKFVSRLC